MATPAAVLPTADERMPRPERRLVDAALALDDAESVEAALAVLADAARELVAADGVSILLWEPGPGGAEIVAGSGIETSTLPGTLAAAAAAVARGEPFVLGPEQLAGAPGETPAHTEAGGTVLCVPVVSGDLPTLSFQATWRSPVPTAVAERAGANLRLLGRLVPLAFRAERSRGLEPQLIESGKLASIGELAAGVAHEINNPLFAILGLVEFLLLEAVPGTKAHERLTLIQETGLEIKEIVRALLDFARERSGERSVTSLADVVAQTVELMRRTSAAKQVEIVERYTDEPTTIEGSANQLKQIFVNLISNAKHALKDGGGTIFVEVGRDGDVAWAEVRDDGPGLTADVAARAFEPFFTTRRDFGGTGLGLSVSLGIAQAHGGSLVVASAPGEGAAFRLRLPLADEGLVA